MTEPSKPLYSLPETISASSSCSAIAARTFPYRAQLVRPRSFNSFDQGRDGLVERGRDAVLTPEADDAAVEPVDLGRPASLDVLEHRRLVAVRDLGLGGMVDQRLGVGVEHDPLRCGDGLALVDEPADEPAQVGALADAPVREPGERADRVRRGVEDHLAPLRAPGVLDGGRRHAAARAGVGEPLDLRRGVAGLGSNGPNVVSPLTSHCTTPGSRIFPAGKVVPRITRATCGAIPSSLPTPFWTEATAPSANACAVAAIAASVCIAFVATIPNSQAGSSAASAVARIPWRAPPPLRSAAGPAR